jgi:hemoglobin
MENHEKQHNLFECLGGVDGISAIVDDVVESHMSNPDIKVRFLPLKNDPKHFAEVRQHLLNFFVMGSGGPQNYSGKDMHTAHVGMNISQGEYISSMDDIMGALDKHNIDEQSQKDVLAILYSLKGQMAGV